MGDSEVADAFAKRPMTRGQKALVIGTLAIIAGLIGASAYSAYNATRDDDNRLSVVASFYPLGYLAKNIGGENVNVITLIPQNSDVHDYAPSVSDVVAADDADVLLYNGAGLDSWFEDEILSTISIGDAAVVETTHGLGLLNFSSQEQDDHDHGDVDPHTWISPYNAIYQGQKIYDAILKADPYNETSYTHNWNNLKQRLQELDDSYIQSLSNASRDTIIVTHEAFGYLAYRYGFDQHGITGLSADEQPSTPVLMGIIDTMVEHGIDTVLVDPGYYENFGDILKSNVENEANFTVNVRTVYLMTGEYDGLDYLEQMGANLVSLEVALEVV